MVCNGSNSLEASTTHPRRSPKTFSGTTTNFAETGIWEAMSQDNTAASRTLLLRQPGTAGLSRGEKFILVVGTTGNVDIGINSADSAAMQIVVFDDQGKRTVVHGTNQRLITPEGGWENSPQNRIYTAEVLTPLRWGLRLGVWWNSASSLAETHPEDAVTFSTTKVIAASDLGKWVAAAQTRGVTRTITLKRQHRQCWGSIRFGCFCVSRRFWLTPICLSEMHDRQHRAVE